MKTFLKILLVASLCLPLTGPATAAPGWPDEPVGPGDLGQGSWSAWSLPEGACGQDQVCAEWLQAGSPNDGTLCCIGPFDMGSTSFSACIEYPYTAGGPRDPGPML